MVWMRWEFPNISYRTLARYRQWVEFEILPEIRKRQEQLQLDLQDPLDIDLTSLPEVKRAGVMDIIRRATSARDVTLTLRAMGEAHGEPGVYGPRGGDHTPRDANGKRILRPKQELMVEKVQAANLRVQDVIDAMVWLDEQACLQADIGLIRKLEQVSEEFLSVARKLLKERERRMEGAANERWEKRSQLSR